jgi:2-oxoglutarate ferredoxin oxidoreductase subunit gamma
MLHQEIVIAGFGGQGILSAGRILAYAGILDNKNVSWLPSYGPEMRGGTANCHIIISDDEVGSPIINSANVIIVMNSPSLEKFESLVEENGYIIADSSLVNRKATRQDVSIHMVPATQMASDMGNVTYAAIVLLGKLIGLTGVVSKESMRTALYNVLPSKYHHMIPEEMAALEQGAGY